MYGQHLELRFVYHSPLGHVVAVVVVVVVVVVVLLPALNLAPPPKHHTRCKYIDNLHHNEVWFVSST